MLPTGAFRISIEEKFGTLPYFFIYALLEWLLIILLFVDGFLAFLSNEIARFFELKTPCLLCTRLDHALVQRGSSFYYNESICEVHKRDVSSLVYCHLHAKLADIRFMCRGCLDSDGGSDPERKLQLKQLKWSENDERVPVFRYCSCCGEPLKSKSSPLRRNMSSSSLTMAAAAAAAASPRASWFSSSNEEVGAMDLQNSRYTELKLIAETDPVLQDSDISPTQGMIAAAREEINVEDVPRTPTFASRNKFFGLPLPDIAAAPMSPSKRLQLEKPELALALDPVEEGEGEGDIVARLKRQVTLDRRSLMALYMELDEERSAAAVAANNAMAMITRLQQEKAAVQMEASQYQRMMEEQKEYDQEAMQMMQDLLFKREEETKELEAELELYREKYGMIKRIGSEVCEVDIDEDYQDIVHAQSLSLESSSTENRSESVDHQCEEFGLDYERERSHLLGMMRELLEGNGGEEESINGGVSLIRERLKAVEEESGFLKHAAMTLQRGGEGMKILSEIAQNLRVLRQKNLESSSSSSS